MPQRSPQNIAFGKALREYRLAHRPFMSQEQLAQVAGLDRTFISLLELGDRSPTLTTIFALAAALQISPLALIEGTLANLSPAQE